MRATRTETIREQNIRTGRKVKILKGIEALQSSIRNQDIRETINCEIRMKTVTMVSKEDPEPITALNLAKMVSLGVV